MSLPGTPADKLGSARAWEPIIGAIGPKVRERRQRLGLSLQQLGSRAEVSAAAIHKVERGDMVPTVTTLLKLAAALGQPISHFVDDSGPAAPVAVHVRANQRPAPPADWASGTNGVTSVSLAGPTDRLRAEAVHAVVEPGGSSGEIRPLTGGEELVLVLDGCLAMEVAGEQYLLQPGDTLHYPTDRVHRWHNPGQEPARAVWWRLRD
jgi:transcriptional regulator with XRE-family HTH domain